MKRTQTFLTKAEADAFVEGICWIQRYSGDDSVKAYAIEDKDVLARLDREQHRRRLTRRGDAGTARQQAETEAGEMMA